METEPPIYGDYRIVLNDGCFCVGVVRELQREHIVDELLNLGRQRSRGLAEDAVRDVDLLPGLVDDRERGERRLVEQAVAAGRPVRLDQDLELPLRHGIRGRRILVELQETPTGNFKVD